MGGSLSKPDPSCTELEVICAGYARTGTSSMQLALEKLLNRPAYHGGTQLWFCNNDAHMKLWGQALDAKFLHGDKERTMKALREVLKGYASTADLPGYLFVPELMEIYPNAKVVLTTRDPEKWWTSMKVLISNLPWYFKVLMFPAPAIRWFPCLYRAWRIHSDELLREAGREHEEYGPDLLGLYNESIIKMVPKDRLLIMQVKEGWGPLAKFLGKPIPAEPFPHVNEAAAVDKHAGQIIGKLILIWLGWISATGLVGAGAFMGWKAWRR